MASEIACIVVHFLSDDKHIGKSKKHLSQTLSFLVILHPVLDLLMMIGMASEIACIFAHFLLLLQMALSKQSSCGVYIQ